MALYSSNFNLAFRPDQKLFGGAFISGSIDKNALPRNQADFLPRMYDTYVD